MEILMQTSTSLTPHIGNLPLGSNFGLINFANVGQTNIAIQIGVAIGGSVVQIIDQSNAIS